MCACTCVRSRCECEQARSHVHTLLHLCPYWTVRSLFFFSPPLLNGSLVLYRCSLSRAITLCPSLPPLRSSFFSFAACSDNLIKGAMRPWAYLLLHHAVTLSREEYSFIGFLSLTFSLSLCLLSVCLNLSFI